MYRIQALDVRTQKWFKVPGLLYKFRKNADTDVKRLTDYAKTELRVVRSAR